MITRLKSRLWLARCGALGQTRPISRMRTILSSPARRFVPWVAIIATACFGWAATAGERIPWTSNQVKGSAYPPAPYRVERLLPNVALSNPLDFAFEPGTGRLFIAEQGGRIVAVDLRQPEAAPTVVADLRQHHQPFDSILGFAFHPGYTTNRWIFVNYNEPGGRADGSFVSRFEVAAGPVPRILLSTEKPIIRWFSGGHNGCTLAFGTDGFLYISTGDGASPDPPDMPFRTGQDNSDLLACILRLDVSRGEGGKAYAVPPDNPFVGMPNVRPEIWAFGFRNPFRMAFDRHTGDLWAGDVGWEQWEMIYRIRRGGNYGWSITEGPNQKVRTDVTPGPGPILPPMVALPHSDAASITGGVVYRGQRLPKLNGAYIYGDWETGRFWALRHDADKLLANEELCDTALKPVAFTLASDGELYILDYSSGIYVFQTNTVKASSHEFPRKLSTTGLFASLQPLEPAPGVVPYKANATMWNDHASASLLLGVPGTDSIATGVGVGNIAGGTWRFPTNTVLARTLALEREAGKPASTRPVETQLLHWDGQTWNPYSYRWNEQSSDAELVEPAGFNASFTVADGKAPGGSRTTPWKFMSRSECLRCHNAWSGDALTLNWMQLGSRSGESELQRLQSLGVLRVTNAPSPLPRPLVDPYDHTLERDLRARSWLHANCAGCHRFGGGASVTIQLNFDNPPAAMRIIDERPQRGDFGLLAAQIVAAGDPYRSSLYYRIRTEGAGHMPLVGARSVDEAGSRLIGDWIRALPVAATNAPPVEIASAIRRLDSTVASLRAGGTSGPSASSTHDVAQLLGTFSGALAVADLPNGNPHLTVALGVARVHTNAFVRDLFERFLPASERRKVLGEDFQSAHVLALTGNAQRGREVFFNQAQCARCHAFNGEGRPYGPDLTIVAKKYSRAQLIGEIVAPSKTVAPEFRTMSVVLKDDREITGFILKRETGGMVLRDESLVDHRIANAEISSQRESILSAMPEGLLAPLTAQEAADLLEFLVSGQPR